MTSLAVSTMPVAWNFPPPFQFGYCFKDANGNPASHLPYQDDRLDLNNPLIQQKLVKAWLGLQGQPNPMPEAALFMQVTILIKAPVSTKLLNAKKLPRLRKGTLSFRHDHLSSGVVLVYGQPGPRRARHMRAEERLFESIVASVEGLTDESCPPCRFWLQELPPLTR